MNLATLIADIPDAVIRGTCGQVTQLTTDSRSAGPGSLFIAIPGTCHDGHDYLDAAFAQGARAFVTERPFTRAGTTNITVPSTRRIISRLAAAFYRYPSRELSLIGIIGTNGKTTTAHLIEHILTHANIPAGLFSTVCCRFAGKHYAATGTTPDPISLQARLREMADAGIRAAVMEVSSHGLDQYRADGCDFQAGVFTNLSPEHLDYHGTMDAYAAAKARFFTEVLPRSTRPGACAIINTADPLGSTLGRHAAITYAGPAANIRCRDEVLSLDGTRAQLQVDDRVYPVRLHLPGSHNLQNAMAAIAAVRPLGIEPQLAVEALAAATGVPGRMERIRAERACTVFVDYAHTADALEKTLATMRACGASRITVVFGCGGDRDRSKRPAMGQVAANLCSRVVLTSDNPRSESSSQIIAEIEQGMQGSGYRRVYALQSFAHGSGVYLICPDRREAIRLAIAAAGAHDTVLIAGKGHERFQEIAGIRYPFDDREEARAAMHEVPPCS